MLAIGGGDGVAVYVGAFGDAPAYHLREHSAPVKDIAFSPGGNLLASCSADMTIVLQSFSAGVPSTRARLRGHRDSVEALAFSPDGALLASGGADHSIRLWTAATGAPDAVWRAMGMT